MFKFFCDNQEALLQRILKRHLKVEDFMDMGQNRD